MIKKERHIRISDKKPDKERYEPDSTDKEIINELIRNSKLSYRDIASRIKKSPATVMNRIKVLEKENIIKKYTTLVDYDRLGYDITVLIDIRISKGNLLKVEKRIASQPNVIAVYDNTGPFDAMIIGRFKNRKTMDHFLKKIQKEEFVERSETRLVLNVLKEECMGIRK